MNSLIKPENLEDLTEYEVSSISLVPEYWTPEEVGEFRNLYYYGVELQPVADFNDPDKTVELECVVFADVSTGAPRAVVNGSKRLVACFRNLALATETPVKVIYIGRKKNRQNNNESDHWDIHLIARKAKA